MGVCNTCNSDLIYYTYKLQCTAFFNSTHMGIYVIYLQYFEFSKARQHEQLSKYRPGPVSTNA